jgi:hypothetical protein
MPSQPHGTIPRGRPSRATASSSTTDTKAGPDGVETPLLRVDLSSLVDELNLEQPAGRWVFDDVESIIRRLRLEGDAPPAFPRTPC